MMDFVSFANVPFTQGSGECILASGHINPLLQFSHWLVPDAENSPGWHGLGGADLLEQLKKNVHTVFLSNFSIRKSDEP
jgi:hypothetical protein